MVSNDKLPYKNRKRLAQMVEDERNFISAVLETAGDLVIVLDGDGCIVRFNRACEKISGYSFEEVKNKCFWDIFILPDEAEKVRGVFALLFAGELFNRAENYWVAKNGEKRLISWSNTLIKGKDGHVQYVVATGVDITERKLAEEALKERTNALTTLLDISQHVVSTLELGPLLGIILDQLKNIVEYSSASVFAVDGEFWTPLAYRGPLTMEQLFKYPIPAKLALSREMIENRKPVIIDDVQDDTPMAVAFRELAGERMKALLDEIRSWIGLPLMVKNNVIGLLTFGYSIPGFYSNRHVELVTAFANHVAVAVENARLYAETRQHADELQTMFTVQQAITSRLELDTVLQLISDEARRLTKSERTTVFLIEGDYLKISVIAGNNDINMLGYRMPIKESLTSMALETGKPVRVNDAKNDPRVYKDVIVRAGVNSFISMPLISGMKPIGAIAVVNKTEGVFGPEDERILTMLASVAVISIENARLYEQEQERHHIDEQHRRVAEGLRDILGKLNSNFSLPEILDYIIKQAGRLLGTDTVALYRLQSDKGLLTIKAACGLPDKYVNEMTIPIGQGVVGRAVLERKPVVVPDMGGQIPPGFEADIQRFEYLSWLVGNYHGVVAVPLIGKDEIYGGIVLYYPELRNFSEEEIDLAMSFADQAVLAIDNARLRAKAEENAVAAERSRLARDLHDAVTQTLFSSSLIAEVLPKIWEKNPGEVMKRLNELRQLTRGALAEMRTLLLELRPSTLVETGLKELLNQLTEAVTGRTRIPITLKIEGQPVLCPDVKIAFYRIAQEALNNIAKHSGATRVEIELSAEGGNPGITEALQLRISDYGRGFEINRITPEHLGLGIMRERAESIGADLRIESHLGEGTEISVKWRIKEGIDLE